MTTKKARTTKTAAAKAITEIQDTNPSKPKREARKVAWDDLNLDQQAVANQVLVQADSLTAKQVREAVRYALQNGDFQKPKREARQKTNPGYDFGDVITVTVRTGKRKGEDVTGRFVRWIESNGTARILDTKTNEEVTGFVA